MAVPAWNIVYFSDLVAVKYVHYYLQMKVNLCMKVLVVIMNEKRGLKIGSFECVKSLPAIYFMLTFKKKPNSFPKRFRIQNCYLG